VAAELRGSSYLRKQSRGPVHFPQASTSCAIRNVASQKQHCEKSLRCIDCRRPFQTRIDLWRRLKHAHRLGVCCDVPRAEIARSGRAGGYSRFPPKHEDHMARKPQVPVKPRPDGRWAVHTEGTQRVDSLHDKKPAAVAPAGELAENKRSELLSRTIGAASWRRIATATIRGGSRGERLAPRHHRRRDADYRLLECPFCASDDLAVTTIEDALAVRCNECGAAGPSSIGNDLQDAVHTWNQRFGRLTAVK
jgi:Lar family restriction alleviation protein